MVGRPGQSRASRGGLVSRLSMVQQSLTIEQQQIVSSKRSTDPGSTCSNGDSTRASIRLAPGRITVPVPIALKSSLALTCFGLCEWPRGNSPSAASRKRFTARPLSSNAPFGRLLVRVRRCRSRPGSIALRTSYRRRDTARPRRSVLARSSASERWKRCLQRHLPKAQA